MKSSARYSRNLRKPGPDVDIQRIDPAEAAASVQATGAESTDNAEMLVRVGQLTRNLHDSLRELGFDKVLSAATVDIPDVRDRLNYVVRMTEQAAQRVLNATDRAIPLQERVDAGANEILSGWQTTLAAPFSEGHYRDMATLTMQCLTDMRSDTATTKEQLLDIMMAQDFQDLTGQVIRKIADLAQGLEQQLVQLLIDYAPEEVRRETKCSLLNGPQIHTANRNDVVVDQGQVDDLLDSLGF